MLLKWSTFVKLTFYVFCKSRFSVKADADADFNTDAEVCSERVAQQLKVRNLPKKHRSAEGKKRGGEGG